MSYSETKKKVRHLIYKSNLRSMARRLGLIRIIFAVPNRLSDFEHRVAFFFHRGRLAAVSVAGHQVTLAVPNFIEFRRAVAMGNEKKIIEPFLKKIRPGDIVFDVGANVGLYAVFIAKAVGKGGRVVAFEPEHLSRERLKENIRLNYFENVLIMNDALGREKSKRFLKPDKNFASGANVIFENKEGSEAAGGEEIIVTSGDMLIKEKALPIPNAIKIDVEGMEDEVLAGLESTLRRPECRLVLCEVHFSNLEKRGKLEAPKHIEETLRSSGFTSLDWLDHSHILAVK